MNLKEELYNQDLVKDRKDAARGWGGAGAAIVVCAFVLEHAALNMSHLQALLTMESIHLQISNFKKGASAWPTLSQANIPGSISCSQEVGHLVQKNTRDPLLGSGILLGERKVMRIQRVTPSHLQVKLETETCREVKIIKILVDLHLNN